MVNQQCTHACADGDYVLTVEKENLRTYTDGGGTCSG